MQPDAKNKDFAQTLKESYDPALERLRVDALINDGVDALVINPDGSINVEGVVSGTVSVDQNGLANIKTTQYTVGTSAVQLTPTPLTGRKSISIKAHTTSATELVYIGNTSGVTTSTGYPLFDGDSLQIDLTDASNLYVIGTLAGQKVYVLELG